MASYCDGPTLVMFYDADRIAQILSTPSAPVTIDQVPGNPIVLLKLASSAGVIDAALRVGDKYQVADLFNLIASRANGGLLLQRMNADLAFKELCDFKAYSAEEVKGMAPTYADTMGLLEALKQGQQNL